MSKIAAILRKGSCFRSRLLRTKLPVVLIVLTSIFWKMDSSHKSKYSNPKYPCKLIHPSAVGQNKCGAFVLAIALAHFFYFCEVSALFRLVVVSVLAF